MSFLKVSIQSSSSIELLKKRKRKSMEHTQYICVNLEIFNFKNWKKEKECVLTQLDYSINNLIYAHKYQMCISDYHMYMYQWGGGHSISKKLKQ